MGKKTSVVWKFFDRIIKKGKCASVVCKLCNSQYKFTGNTTNLRVHLKNKHPIQWNLFQNGADPNFDLESILATGNVTIGSPIKRVKHSKSRDNSTKTAGVKRNDNSQLVDDNITLELIQQMHGEEPLDEEWLEDESLDMSHSKSKSHKIYHTVMQECPVPPVSSQYSYSNVEKARIKDDKIRDEHSVFGEYIANKLRSIKKSRTCSNLQQIITTIIWQAENGAYDNADAVNHVLLMDYKVQEPQNIVEFDPANTVEREEVILYQSDDAFNDSHSEHSKSLVI